MNNKVLSNSYTNKCETCKHQYKAWEEEPCDSCTKEHNGYEPADREYITQSAGDEIRQKNYERVNKYDE